MYACEVRSIKIYNLDDQPLKLPLQVQNSEVPQYLEECMYVKEGIFIPSNYICFKSNLAPIICHFRKCSGYIKLL